MALPIASVVAGALIDPTTFGNELVDAINAAPRGRVGYAQVTASQGSIVGNVDLTGLSVTWTAVAGRRYRITGEAFMSSTASGDLGNVAINTSANAQVQAGQTVMSVYGSAKITCQAILTGLSGSVTYKLRAARSGGTGTLTMDAAATYPAFILVEDIGT
jgi:hypothetical protein